MDKHNPALYLGNNGPRVYQRNARQHQQYQVVSVQKSSGAFETTPGRTSVGPYTMSGVQGSGLNSSRFRVERTP